MGIRQISQNVVKITRKLADEFAGMKSIQDRPLNERRITHYLAELAEGRFRSPEWATAKSLESGGRFRVNGQHTSTMFSRMDAVPELSAVVSHYKCDTDVDVCTLWGTFDSKSVTRSVLDINHAFSSIVPEFADVPSKIINVCVSGINFHESGGEYGMMNKRAYSVRSRAMIDNQDFVRFVRSLDIADNDNAHIRKTGVVAAMFGTWLKSKPKCGQFWRAVRNEDGASPNLPDRVLAKWLRSVPAYGTGRTRSVAPREMYAKCIMAWNAWREGVTLVSLKYGPAKRVQPIR